MDEIQCYQPEIWQVDKTAIYNARRAINTGLFYARVYQSKFDNSEEGVRFREMVEKDIREMNAAVEALKQLKEDS